MRSQSITSPRPRGERVRWRRGLAVLCAVVSCGAHAAEPPVIAAASSMTDALVEIAARFTRDSGERVRLSFGSSNNLARQIRQGAPFALFLSADEEQAVALARDGHTEGDGTLYAEGRLVLFVPKGSPIKADDELRDFAAAVDDGRLRRLAIANPEHAPYGQRAQEALTHAGLWTRVKQRLVIGENISQAAQFALSGSVEASLLALSLARSPRLSGHGDYVLIPAAWHRPLRQRMVLIKGAGGTARRFYLYMSSEPVREILERYGFDTPPR